MPPIRQFQPRRRSSDLYDSRDTPNRGIGFPSCSRELARCPPNFRDPHGYYAEMGLRPDATEDEVRVRVRQLYRRYHPDTGDCPDVLKLQRVHSIAEVLLNPLSRDRYNKTPVGLRLMDKVYAGELSKLGDLNALDEEEIRSVLQPQQASRCTDRYDYFALDHDSTGDPMRADLWYRHLVHVAPMVHYRRSVKVMLHDGPRGGFDEAAAIMMIPRRWEPSSALAYMLFTVVAGCHVLRDETDLATR